MRARISSKPVKTSPATGKALFWDIRSKFYWHLENSPPYRGLIRDIIQKFDIKRGHHILDAGCGTGNFEKIITQRNLEINIEALDSSQGMIKQARKINKNAKNVRFVRGDLDGPLNYNDETFHAIVCNNVLYLLHSPQHTLKEFYRILKWDGQLVISTPKPNFSPFPLIKDSLKGRNWVERLKNIFLLFSSPLTILPFEALIRYRIERGCYHKFEKNEIEILLKKSGFRDIDISTSCADQNFIVSAKK